MRYGFNPHSEHPVFLAAQASREAWDLEITRLTAALLRQADARKHRKGRTLRPVEFQPVET